MGLDGSPRDAESSGMLVGGVPARMTEIRPVVA